MSNYLCCDKLNSIITVQSFDLRVLVSSLVTVEVIIVTIHLWILKQKHTNVKSYIITLILPKVKSLCVRIPLRQGVLDTTLCDKVCQWLVAGQWFSPVSSTNKTDRHEITEILNVALNTITVILTLKLFIRQCLCPDSSIFCLMLYSEVQFNENISPLLNW